MSWSVGEVWVLATGLQGWEPRGSQVWVPATGGHWGAEVWIQSRVGVQAQLLERSVFHECILTVAFKLHRAERRSGSRHSCSCFWECCSGLCEPGKRHYSLLWTVWLHVCVSVCVAYVHWQHMFSLVIDWAWEHRTTASWRLMVGWDNSPSSEDRYTHYL